MNCKPLLAGNHDRPGWFALLFPLSALSLAVLLPIPLLSVGWDGAALVSWAVGCLALPASVVFAIIVAARSWRDRPLRRNRALCGLVLGLLLTALCVLALIELNRKSAALEKLLEQAGELETP